MIDWDRVTELRDEIGAEDFAEVVEIFLDEVEEEMTKLDDAAGQENLQAIFHFLKGSAVNLGFAQFSELCQQGENAGRTGDGVDVKEVKSCYATSKSEFLGALNKLDAA